MSQNSQNSQNIELSQLTDQQLEQAFFQSSAQHIALGESLKILLSEITKRQQAQQMKETVNENKMTWPKSNSIQSITPSIGSFN